jgi:CPA2 family monovalent cation:H+ antiporter-2
MGSELNLVADLAVILVAAGIFTVISRALKQPPILGYIIAGFLVSPHLGLLPAISSVESVEQWSEIGIIFLLFALGLEFSFKKLLKVGSSALITAGTNCIGMFMVGLTVGSVLGWSTMESLFLGGMMSMSSSSVIIKAFNDLGLKRKSYAPLVFGSLIVQDLIAVVLMVLLSTLAVSNQFSGAEMIWNLAKLAFFIILWFLVGIYVIPSLLKRARKYLNDEILLIISIGLCFGMVTLATAVGFSSALGAFVMGSILAETIEGEHIEHLVSGIKDLFGAIFFVSVGMMIDPAVIGEHWGTILVIALLAVGGIMTFITIGALLAGKSLDTAVHTGFSLAQLGEFGFILASLGVSLGVMRGFIYPVIIAVSVLTTFATPFMIKAADPASLWLHRKLPAKLLARLNTSDEETLGSVSSAKGEWKSFLTAYATRIALYSIVLIAILIGSHTFLDGLLEKLMKGLNPVLIKWTGVIVTLVVMAPFLYGLSVQRGSLQGHVKKLLQEKDSNKWPILSLMILRLLLAIVFILVFISSKFDLSWWAVLLIVAATLILLRILPRYIKLSGLEDRFISNLNAREMESRRKAPVTTKIRDTLSGYDVHTDSFYISPDSQYIGQRLRDIPFRSTTGVNIVKIVRGSRSILIPKGEERVYPYDRLLAVGTGSQIADFAKMMENEVVDPRSLHFDVYGEDQDFAIEIIPVTESSYLYDKALKDLSMRQRGCMVLSVLRNNEFITNPRADFHFQEGDSVWIAGEKESCESFR